MSTDTFEGELRSLLHDTADAEGPAYVDVDPNAVVTQGRRVIRRRRVAVGLGVAAATVVLGVAGVTALGSGVDGSEPVPGSSATVLATGTATADLAPGASLPEGATGPTGAPDVRVSVDRGTGELTYLADRDGVMEVLRSDRLPSSARAAMWLPTSVEGLVVGVLPKDARDVASERCPS
jgi:hypothetical protein